ncbi:coronatine-insensitive protein 1-like protein [Tanacetum coccineum]
MEEHRYESMDTVFNCVISYIHNGEDRNAVSLVCRKWYELDCMARKHVTVLVVYLPTPSRLLKRFLFIESLTLKGLPLYFMKNHSCIGITPWFKEIAVSFKYLKVLHVRCFSVLDSDHKDYNTLNEKDGKWLHELAVNNKCIETLNFYDTAISKVDVNDLTLLAKNCRSLVSLKLTRCGLSDLKDFFRISVMLEVFAGGNFTGEEKDVGFKFPLNLRSVEFVHMTQSQCQFVIPHAHRLTELNLTYDYVDESGLFYLINKCPNLEALYTIDIFGDRGLQLIAKSCKKLRKLETFGLVTHRGMVALAQGCPFLECLHIQFTDISDETLKCIGVHLKRLRDFQMTLCKEDALTNLPLDSGFQALLIGCSKLERLIIRLRSGGLTDAGLGYIGKYGLNLRYLSLGYIGGSDAGLVKLSKGCPKLRKLEIQNCPFSMQALSMLMINIRSLRDVMLVMQPNIRIKAIVRITSKHEEKKKSKVLVMNLEDTEIIISWDGDWNIELDEDLAVTNLQ